MNIQPQKLFLNFENTLRVSTSPAEVQGGLGRPKPTALCAFGNCGDFFVHSGIELSRKSAFHRNMDSIRMSGRGIIE